MTVKCFDVRENCYTIYLLLYFEINETVKLFRVKSSGESSLQCNNFLADKLTD